MREGEGGWENSGRVPRFETGGGGAVAKGIGLLVVVVGAVRPVNAHQILWHENGLVRSPPNGLEQIDGECQALHKPSVQIPDLSSGDGSALYWRVRIQESQNYILHISFERGVVLGSGT
ncbi:hypothetical protein AVEN_244268-1 [Araneus ventricosus]|uniref:Uncharacterized protein n=1 Tax=Araneus ventricosus TaxID=182803 RepID=A0A4Y2LIV2_ARAVE|nr:hypothetical protein AVEN_27305-1 [Araneus ventricosus]GBN14688.1 hypothetical protein AVEN_244268-1 [Araneus ventricosus]